MRLILKLSAIWLRHRIAKSPRAPKARQGFGESSYWRNAVALLFALIPLLATAQPAGHDSPRLQTAIQAWLANEDQTALPALAELAAGGNTAAQILLGRIDRRPRGQWLANLPWKDRSSLMRAPNDGFGMSWLKIAAERGDELANLFQNAKSGPPTENDLTNLLAAGELTEAQILMRRLREPGDNMNWPQNLEKLVERGELGADMRYARWYWLSYSGGQTEAEKQQKTRQYLDEFINSAPYNDPGVLSVVFRSADITNALNISFETAHQLQMFLLTGLNTSEPHDNFDKETLFAFGQILNRAAPTNRPLSPLRHLCQTHCEEELEICLAAGVATLQGYERLRNYASPTETLIPFETYATSARAIADLQTGVQKRSIPSPADWREHYRQTLSCFDAAFPPAP